MTIAQGGIKGLAVRSIITAAAAGSEATDDPRTQIPLLEELEMNFVLWISCLQ